MKLYTVSDKLLDHAQTKMIHGVRGVPFAESFVPVHRELPDNPTRASVVETSWNRPILIPEHQDGRDKDCAGVFLTCPLRDRQAYRVYYKFPQDLYYYERRDLWDRKIDACSRHYLVRLEEKQTIIRKITWSGRTANCVIIQLNKGELLCRAL